MSHYVCVSMVTDQMMEKVVILANKTGSALVKSANATKEFFRMYPDAVGNIYEAQGILSHLPGFADFGELKADGSAFKQTFLGLDNALRKGTAEVVKGKVLWKGSEYSYKHCLFAIAIVGAARKQASKKGTDTATVVKKKASREELASFISELIALCDEHSIRDDRRYGRLLDKWLEMEI